MSKEIKRPLWMKSKRFETAEDGYPIPVYTEEEYEDWIRYHAEKQEEKFGKEQSRFNAEAFMEAEVKVGLAKIIKED